MQEITAYQTVDGQVFNDEDDAERHEIDLIGEELDGLIMHVLNLDVSQRDKKRKILAAIAERNKLKQVVALLNRYLNSED